jgi:hypothetical protein
MRIGEAEHCEIDEELELLVEWYRVESTEIDSSKCCFDDVELYESASCSNLDSPHHFCFACTRMYAETEMGKGKQNPSLNTLTLDPSSSVWMLRGVLLCSQTLKSNVSWRKRLLNIIKISR